MTAYFSVTNYDQQQHYKDRGPTWIKLYNRLLDDYAFANLPDETKWHLIGIQLLASRHAQALSRRRRKEKVLEIPLAQRRGEKRQRERRIYCPLARTHLGFWKGIQKKEDLIRKGSRSSGPLIRSIP